MAKLDILVKKVAKDPHVENTLPLFIKENQTLVEVGLLLYA